LLLTRARRVVRAAGAPPASFAAPTACGGRSSPSNALSDDASVPMRSLPVVDACCTRQLGNRSPSDRSHDHHSAPPTPPQWCSSCCHKPVAAPENGAGT
jgi:hypothetical protein